MSEIYPMSDEEVDDCASWPGVYWDYSFTANMRAWLNENIDGDWWHTGVSGRPMCEIVFEKEEDAMAFKLRWL